MNQIGKKLILKKKTVAVLNEQELNNVKGGAGAETMHPYCPSVKPCEY